MSHLPSLRDSVPKSQESPNLVSQGKMGQETRREAVPGAGHPGGAEVPWDSNVSWHHSLEGGNLPKSQRALLRAGGQGGGWRCWGPGVVQAEAQAAIGVISWAEV